MPASLMATVHGCIQKEQNLLFGKTIVYFFGVMSMIERRIVECTSVYDTKMEKLCRDM